MDLPHSYFGGANHCLKVIAEELGLEKDMMALVGVAVGYEDLDHPINHLKGQKERLEHSVEFVDN